MHARVCSPPNPLPSGPPQNNEQSSPRCTVGPVGYPLNTAVRPRLPNCPFPPAAVSSAAQSVSLFLLDSTCKGRHAVFLLLRLNSQPSRSLGACGCPSLSSRSAPEAGSLPCGIAATHACVRFPRETVPLRIVTATQVPTTGGGHLCALLTFSR